MSEEKSAKDSIQLLFEQYSDDVYRYARIILGNDADARDVVQEVFLSAFRSWKGFRGESEPRTWLISIARHCAFKLFGKRKRELDFLSKYEPPYVRDESEIFETLLTVEHALNHLKDSYRQVIMLRHIECFSVKQTAQILCWSESKVKTTDQRAMNKLRELLGGSYEGGIVQNEIRAQHS